MKIIDEPFLIHNDRDRNSFRNRYWQTALLSKGDMLYRIYTPGHNHIIKTLADRVHPALEKGTCWMDSATYLRLFRLAGNSQYIQSFAARAVLALQEEWNPAMSRLATAVVQKPLKAAYGIINWQPLTENTRRPDYNDIKNVMLTGGGHQYFILLEDANKIWITSDTEISPEANVVTKLTF